MNVAAEVDLGRKGPEIILLDAEEIGEIDPGPVGDFLKRDPLPLPHPFERLSGDLPGKRLLLGRGGRRLLSRRGDPLRNLASAFLHHSESTAAKYEPDLRETLYEYNPAVDEFVEALEHDPSPELESLVRKGLAEIAARQKLQVPRYRH